MSEAISCVTDSVLRFLAELLLVAKRRLHADSTASSRCVAVSFSVAVAVSDIHLQQRIGDLAPSAEAAESTRCNQ